MRCCLCLSRHELLDSSASERGEHAQLKGAAIRTLYAMTPRVLASSLHTHAPQGTSGPSVGGGRDPAPRLVTHSGKGLQPKQNWSHMGHQANTHTLTCIAPLYSALEWKHEAFFQ